MKTKLLVLGMLTAAYTTLGCQDDEPTEDAGEESPFTIGEPSDETRKVFLETAGYQSWEQFEDTLNRPASEGHMDMYVESFYNEVAGQALEDGTLPLPDGSVLVKEAYMMVDDESPMAITVMSKREGQWYWAQLTTDGQLMLMDGTPLEGRNVEMCIGCHSNAAADNDLVVTPFP